MCSRRFESCYFRVLLSPLLAGMVEVVDTEDLKSSEETRVGSNPTLGTEFERNMVRGWDVAPV